MSDIQFKIENGVMKPVLPVKKSVGDFKINDANQLFKYVGKETGNLVIPSNVRLFRAGVFTNCVFNSVEIPEGVIALNTSLFEDCKLLETVKLPSTIRVLGQRAFYNCKALKDIVLPEGLEFIGDDCFYNCESLERIIIPGSVRVIPNTCFARCKNLKEIVLSEGVQVILNGAFMEVDFNAIKFPSTITDIAMISLKKFYEDTKG